jgi:hypothetical protein
LPPDVRWLGKSCGELARVYNARPRPAAHRLAAMRADVTVVARPGTPPPALPHWSVDCLSGAR